MNEHDLNTKNGDLNEEIEHWKERYNK